MHQNRRDGIFNLVDFSRFISFDLATWRRNVTRGLAATESLSVIHSFVSSQSRAQSAVISLPKKFSRSSARLKSVTAVWFVSDARVDFSRRVSNPTIHATLERFLKPNYSKSRNRWDRNFHPIYSSQVCAISQVKSAISLCNLSEKKVIQTFLPPVVNTLHYFKLLLVHYTLFITFNSPFQNISTPLYSSVSPSCQKQKNPMKISLLLKMGIFQTKMSV